ncbi:DUF4920 domain-containing protein [Christiangramia sp. SM2212]|uniref:DUF4920 domain-containing protein n=1 Tax=Christiangramia sediminicola TaxID=3073267 RepID=A0ABU1ENU1_9FLAO|nr:DUF4920 domain-containing protein [Christiangramia sp. SM2212]MDR5589644.1 DUF4920 domain-containing protein [Christiangramia sp. SM2212]
MRKSILIVFLFAGLISCKNNESDRSGEIVEVQEIQETYKSFGEKITSENSLTAAQMEMKFNELQPGDTLKAKFTTTVNSVCKMKGCWMTLELPNSEEDPMVKFKDYGFFMPKDIEGKEVIVEGLAFIEETSVEDQKHFAKDGGKSEEEISMITEPKKSPGFLAHGVLLKE